MSDIAYIRSVFLSNNSLKITERNTVLVANLHVRHTIALIREKSLAQGLFPMFRLNMANK